MSARAVPNVWFLFSQRESDSCVEKLLQGGSTDLNAAYSGTTSDTKFFSRHPYVSAGEPDYLDDDGAGAVPLIKRTPRVPYERAASSSFLAICASGFHHVEVQQNT